MNGMTTRAVCSPSPQPKTPEAKTLAVRILVEKTPEAKILAVRILAVKTPEVKTRAAASRAFSRPWPKAATK
ncbi:hypothetical protein RVM25_36975, partial [Enterobacter hormaechei subsp. xiangfangensis]